MKTPSLTAFALCAFAGFSLSSYCADEPKPDAPKTPAGDAAKAVEPDPFKVPENADSAKLIEFSKNVLAQRQKVHNREEYLAFQQKMRPALKEAAEAILKLEKDETSENARFAQRNLLGLGIQTLVNANDAEMVNYLNAVKGFILAKDISKEDAGLVMGIGQFLEQKDKDKAKDFYAGVVPAFKASKIPEVGRYAAILEGSVRRLGLIGNEMELRGTTVDGKPFNVASLKGKVVLVDFWATWCHYCIEELPNVKKNYAGYHNKGFEVVGVSGDQKRANLDEFLQTEKLPWIQLYEEGGRNDAMMQYAIAGFPTTFLIGKDGKVLSLSARGDELAMLLKKELGEPEAVPEAKSDAKSGAASVGETPKK